MGAPETADTYVFKLLGDDLGARNTLKNLKTAPHKQELSINTGIGGNQRGPRTPTSQLDESIRTRPVDDLDEESDDGVSVDLSEYDMQERVLSDEELFAILADKHRF